MRKYYQAALAVTAVVSLVSLLIYRHEYNKLRYVLEVFNYFGKLSPRTVDTNCTSYNSSYVRFHQKFDEPIPSWQRLEDDLYIYSVYNINYQMYKEVRAIGIGTVNSIANVQCLVFFEDESKPVLGSLKFVPIAKLATNVEDAGYRAYHFVCAYTSSKTPTGITFVTKSNKYLDYAPIFPIRMLPKNPSDNGVVMCVIQSSTKPTRLADMIGFVSYHALIGMNNFVVYDSGIPSEFNARVKELADDPNSAQTLIYTIIPWNFPFVEIERSVAREIAEMDCLYRTYNVAYAAALSWNEYVVPRYHRTMMDLMTDVRRTHAPADRYGLRTMTFCTQQADSKRYANSTLTILTKTKSNVNAREDRPVYIHQPHKVVQAQLQSSRVVRTKEMSRNLATVNQYRYCDSDKETHKIHEVEDAMILRFAQDVQDSWILKRYRDSR